MSDLTFSFVQPSLPLSLNKSNSMHWAERRRYLSDWRLMCRIEFQKAAMQLDELEESPVNIEFTFTFPRKGRRDPHNYVATAKSLVDELVIAGLVPDDTAEWVTVVEPVLRIDADNTCTVRIQKRG